MKKFLALSLACLMALTLSVGIYADESNVSVGVKVNEVDPILLFDIDWETFDFTYVYEETWAEGNKAVGYNGLGWKKENEGDNTAAESITSTITFTNYSNGAVDVTIEYVDDTTGANEVAGAEVSLTRAEDTLASAEGATDYATLSADLVVGGKPTATENVSKVVVGKVVVTIDPTWE